MTGNCRRCDPTVDNTAWLDHCPWPRHNGSSIDVAVWAGEGGTHALDILVENLGRPAPDLVSLACGWRGLASSFVRVGGLDVAPWRMHPFPLTMLGVPRAATDALHWVPVGGSGGGGPGGPTFYRGSLVVPGNPPRDTFLRFETTNATASGGGGNVNWNGFLAVNGRNVGRLEALGPQRTLYVPGSFLRRGANDVLVFDATGRLRGRPPALVSQGWAELGPSVPW